MTEIIAYVSMSRVTISKIKKVGTSAVRKYFRNNPIKMGGPDRKVQIDEVMINHSLKSHKGRSPRSQCWVLCIVDCSTSPAKGFCSLLNDRSKTTILPDIKQVVMPGSKIFTDEFKSYSDLGKDKTFIHRTVCHKYNFVDPESGNHTQSVESFNNKLKHLIKKRKSVIPKKNKVCMMSLFCLITMAEVMLISFLNYITINKCFLNFITVFFPGGHNIHVFVYRG